MPLDDAQSRVLTFLALLHLAEVSRIANDEGPPRPAGPHADETQRSPPRSLSSRLFRRDGACAHRSQAADASAPAFVNDIYAAYKGKDAKGHPLDDEPPSAAISSRRGRP